MSTKKRYNKIGNFWSFDSRHLAFFGRMTDRSYVDYKADSAGFRCSL